MDITELLAFSAKQGASDLHLSAGLPPMIRVDGDVRRINVPPMEHKQVHSLIYEIMNDKQRKDFEEFLETDFSFEVPGVARFRVNAFNQNRGDRKSTRLNSSHVAISYAVFCLKKKRTHKYSILEDIIVKNII